MRQPLNAGDPYFIPTVENKRFQIGVTESGEKLFALVNSVSSDSCPIKGMKFRWITTLDQRRFASYTRSYGTRQGYTIVGGGLKLPVLKKLTADLGLPEAYVDIARGRIAYAEHVLVMKPVAAAIEDAKELTDHERVKRGAMLESHLARIEGRGITPVHRQVGDHMDRRAFHTREDRPFVSMVPAPVGG